MKFAIDNPAMADFVEGLQDINALADNATGFVLRLQDDGGDATAIEYFGNDRLVNMSVWDDLESLHAYVYCSAHNEVMRCAGNGSIVSSMPTRCCGGCLAVTYRRSNKPANDSSPCASMERVN